MSLPRILATSSGSRRFWSAASAARVRLTGLLLPSDLVRMSRMPANSTTARTEPPAITPAPGAAGRIITLAAPKSWRIGCGMVEPSSGTRTRCFLAISAPLRMASGTSFAFPRPTPTVPFASPTTTSALKLKRRPPLTTFATRLILTTRSSRFSPVGSILGMFSPATQARCEPSGPDRARSSRPPLEFQPAFAGAVGEGLDAPVVQEATAIEHDRRDALLLGALGEELPDLLGPVALARLLAVPQRRFEIRGRHQGGAGGVVDDLPVDVLQRAEDRQARSLGGPAQVAPNAAVPLLAQATCIWSLEHGRSYFLPLAPALPAFRRIVSSAYLIPLPLYGSGGRIRRMRAAVSPTSSLSAPLTTTRLFPSRVSVTPSGASKPTGWENPSWNITMSPARMAR